VSAADLLALAERVERHAVDYAHDAVTAYDNLQAGKAHLEGGLGIAASAFIVASALRSRAAHRATRESGK
jgi:hypothetical protein